MPRQAHGRPVLAGKTNKEIKKRATTNRRLNALEIAEQENPDEIKIRRHRLGEVDDHPEDPRSRPDVDERSSKRRKIANAQGDESAEEGSDLDGNRWHVGVDDDEEDSDIDSEEAFGDSDEEKFGGFAFRGSRTASTGPKRHRGSGDGDLDDQELSAEDHKDDEADDDLGDEAIDLATAWDIDDEAEKEASRKRRKRADLHESGDEGDGQSASESDEKESSEDEDDAESQLSVSDEEGDHLRLQQFVEGLGNGIKVKSPKKQQQIQSLPDKPSQFGLSSSKISAADLLQYIKDPRQRQSLKILQNSEGRGNEVYKGGVPGKLAPPLVKRQQDRLDRSAAYEESKKELSKWIETVKRNRRADHLSFPLEDPATAAALSGTQLGPTSQSQPMTSLESTIQEIMMESGILSKDHLSQENHEQAYEEMHEKRMPLEEVQARRAELRRARDLMFREEIRARRIKKIKSKAYRRVHRKERDKANLESRSLLTAQGLIDSEEEREKNDRRRAEERMGARHRESKWARSVKATGRAAWDDDARHGVTDLARRDEELRRRIEGKAVAGSDVSESESSDSDAFSETDNEKEGLQTKLNDIDHDESDTPESRLGAMAFMKRAEAVRKAANDEEIRSLRHGLRHDEGSPAEGSDLEDGMPAGRQKFGFIGKNLIAKPEVRVEKGEFEERESESEEDEAHDGDGEKEKAANDPATTAGASADAAHGSKVSRLPNSKIPANNALKDSPKPKLQFDKKIKKAANDISPNDKKPQRKTPAVPPTKLADYSGSSESEDEPDSRAALARAIFAGPDEVEQDFAKEKKETVEEEGDQVIDNSLPGWGSWAGEGISKKAQKRARGRFLTTVKGVAEDKRQDAKLDRVIINEKRVKKNSKYLASELPHPFESRQQYERSLRLPLGPEWTTKSTFQDSTKPRVLMKQGIIRPMAKPLV